MHLAKIDVEKETKLYPGLQEEQADLAPLTPTPARSGERRGGNEPGEMVEAAPAKAAAGKNKSRRNRKGGSPKKGTQRKGRSPKEANGVEEGEEKGELGEMVGAGTAKVAAGKRKNRRKRGSPKRVRVVQL